MPQISILGILGKNSNRENESKDLISKITQEKSQN